MTGQWRFYLTGSGLALLLALAGCGRSMLQTGERAAWRHQAEVTCMKSGAVKMGAGIVQIEPIEGPGMCGAEFPLKVAALGGSSAAIGYGDEVRPPGSIRNPLDEMRYGRPVQAPPIQVQPARGQPVQGEIMRWSPGPQPVRTPSNYEPAGRPVSLSPPGSPSYDAPAPEPMQAPMQAPTQAPRRAPYPSSGVIEPDDDVPDDAILPPGRGAPRTQPAYNAPRYEPEPQRAPPALGPSRGPQSTGTIMPATLQPAATLACPLVSALDKWVAEGVQPAAMKWFGSQVTTIKQISAYSCRGMVGAGTSRISEHAFGNALDVAGFVLADGRKIVVKDGWRGSPEEQGFLHDVQLQACDMFTTVLAPGYNAAHYDHIHVDLMRRANGRRPCRPEAIPGEVAAAKARSLFARRNGGRDYTSSIGKSDVTGSISAKDRDALKAIAGEDGEFDEDDEVTTGSISSGWPRLAPAQSKSGFAAANDAVIRAEERRSKNQ